MKDGFTDKEVADAKLARDAEAAAWTATTTASWAGRSTNQAYLGRTWRDTAELDAAIESLTPAQVNAALRKYVRADGFAIAEAGDFARVKR